MSPNLYKKQRQCKKKDYYYKFHEYKFDKNTWVVLNNVFKKDKFIKKTFTYKISDTIIQDSQAIAVKFNEYCTSISQHTYF